MVVPADPVDGRGNSGGFMARRADVRAQLRRYAPILRWLPHYDPDDLRSDVLSGVWLWAVAVPVALSYGALAGVPPEYGLITAAAGLALYAVFGSNRHLKVTATSTMIFFMAAAIASFTLQTTGEMLNITIVNLGTFLGALCFFAGAYLLLPPRTTAAKPAA